MAHENRKRQNVITAWLAKTALSKLLVGKFGLGEGGSFYGPSHHLKHLHYWKLNHLHSAASFRGGCASNQPC